MAKPGRSRKPDAPASRLIARGWWRDRSGHSDRSLLIQGGCPGANAAAADDGRGPSKKTIHAGAVYPLFSRPWSLPSRGIYSREARLFGETNWIAGGLPGPTRMSAIPGQLEPGTIGPVERDESAARLPLRSSVEQPRPAIRRLPVARRAGCRSETAGVDGSVCLRLEYS